MEKKYEYIFNILVQFNAFLDENRSRKIEIVMIWTHINILTNKPKINGHNDQNIHQYNKNLSAKKSNWFFPFSAADNNWPCSLLTPHFQHFQHLLFHISRQFIALEYTSLDLFIPRARTQCSLHLFVNILHSHEMAFIKNMLLSRRRWILTIQSKNNK